MGQSTKVVEEELERSVEEYWSFDTGWKWNEFESHLSSSLLLEIARKGLSQDENAEDLVFWLEGKKQFKVKDAYKLAMA